MLPSADDKEGAVTVEVGVPAVITGVDVSTCIPVERTEGLVSAKVVPRVVISAEVEV